MIYKMIAIVIPKTKAIGNKKVANSAKIHIYKGAELRTNNVYKL